MTENYPFVGIVGSRSIDNHQLIPVLINYLIRFKATTVVSGGAIGVDTLAVKAALKHGLSFIIKRPQKDLPFPHNMFKRSREIVDASDILLVVWDEKSPGTRYTIHYAKKQGKKIIFVNPRP